MSPGVAGFCNLSQLFGLIGLAGDVMFRFVFSVVGYAVSFITPVVEAPDVTYLVQALFA
jgi:hypothetical protein